MRIILNIADVLVTLMGVVWFLQGINILPGSVMTSQSQWAIYRAITAITGKGLLVLANRRSAFPPRKS